MTCGLSAVFTSTIIPNRTTLTAHRQLFEKETKYPETDDETQQNDCPRPAYIFGLCALAFAHDRPLDNIASRQYQHEVRPLRLALDRWLRELGLQEFGLSIRLVKASDLAPNSCGTSTYDVRSLVGEIDVLRSDE
jgi:hypothetical protein